MSDFVLVEPDVLERLLDGEPVEPEAVAELRRRLDAMSSSREYSGSFGNNETR